MSASSTGSSTGSATGPPARSRTRLPGRGYWWYLLPMGAGFAAIVLAPFAANLWYSFHTWQGGAAPKRWNGLGNYRHLLHDTTFWDSLRNSVYMIAGIVVVPTVIGLVIAAVLFDYIGRRFGDRVAGFLRATFYLPQILPIAVAGVLWSWILDARNGVLTSALHKVGAGSPDWLGDPEIAIYSVLLVLVWLQIGYPVVIFMAALQRVDPELYEAAELDGAGWWRRFTAITVPQIRPEVFVVVLTATVGALKVFAPVLILTQGGPQSSTYVPSYYSYLNFFEYSRVGYGAAIATVMSVVIVVVAMVLLTWQRWAARRDEA
jgi:raffinose/stachyose/melibiose transport system permease protein